MIRFTLTSLAAGAIAAPLTIATACPPLTVYDRFVCTPGSAIQFITNNK